MQCQSRLSNIILTESQLALINDASVIKVIFPFSLINLSPVHNHVILPFYYFFLLKQLFQTAYFVFLYMVYLQGGLISHSMYDIFIKRTAFYLYVWYVYRGADLYMYLWYIFQGRTDYYLYVLYISRKDKVLEMTSIPWHMMAVDS